MSEEPPEKKTMGLPDLKAASLEWVNDSWEDLQQRVQMLYGGWRAGDYPKCFDPEYYNEASMRLFRVGRKRFWAPTLPRRGKKKPFEDVEVCEGEEYTEDLEGWQPPDGWDSVVLPLEAADVGVPATIRPVARKRKAAEESEEEDEEYSSTSEEEDEGEQAQGSRTDSEDDMEETEEGTVPHVAPVRDWSNMRVTRRLDMHDTDGEMSMPVQESLATPRLECPSTRPYNKDKGKRPVQESVPVPQYPSKRPVVWVMSPGAGPSSRPAPAPPPAAAPFGVRPSGLGRLGVGMKIK